MKIIIRIGNKTVLSRGGCNLYSVRLVFLIENPSPSIYIVQIYRPPDDVATRDPKYVQRLGLQVVNQTIMRFQQVPETPCTALVELSRLETKRSTKVNIIRHIDNL